jgi:D-glycero-D-manno-heptose 1,7-bisphosphate phosphatase
MSFSPSDINLSWTLFLDRDGVLNYEKHLDYIYNWEEFVFYEGVKEAVKIFAEKFSRIIIATNQRGVGKGLMTEDDLLNLHTQMTAALEAEGGRIDAIYYCTALDNNHPNRKPNPGMALQAVQDFPETDMKRSIMVGNNISDMEFGRNAGMHTVFLRTTQPGQLLPHPAVDLAFDSLHDFAKWLSA